MSATGHTHGGTRVAVVGAGIVGLSIAFHLFERGAAAVTVVDREGIGAGASGVQPGGVRQQWSTPLGCLLARESYAFYRDLAERLPATTASARLEACGYLFVADRPSTLAELEANVRVQNDLGIPSRVVDAAEAAAIAPALDPEAFLGASYCAEDGYFDRPQSVVEMFAEAVRALGGAIEVGRVDEIRPAGSGWSLRGPGAPSGGFDAVVVAAGADSVPLLAALGHELPVAASSRHLFYSEPIAERLIDPLVVAVDRGLAVKQLAGGRVLASDLHARSGEGDAAQWRRRIRRNVLELVPLLEFVSLPILVEGSYDMTPDAQPVVDPLGGAGVWVSAGFSGHGFMIAPTIGRLVAAGVAGDDWPGWAGGLRLDRFAGAAEVERRVI